MTTKSILSLIISLAATTLSGCSEANTKAEKAKTDAEAKARAEAAKKEMETLPKVFRSRDIFEKNEPSKAPSTPSETTKKS